MVEVELDLVRRAADRLVTSELELLDEVLVRVLGHPAPLVGVQEHVVDVKRSTDEASVAVHARSLLEVSGPPAAKGHHPTGCGGGNGVVSSGRYGPQHVLEVVHLEDDLDLVVLEGNERDSKTRVLAVPELQRNVKGRSRESVPVHAPGAADRSRGIADGLHRLAAASGEVGQLGGVTNHLVVAFLLARGDRELVPDVHPVTILAIDPLAADLNFDTADDLLTRVVKPPGRRCCSPRSHHRTRVRRSLDLWESHLKVGPVGEIAIPANSASDPTTEVGLAIESLFDRLCSKIGVSSVCNLPESDLRVASKINVLSAVCDKLHQSASHFILLLKKRFREFARKRNTIYIQSGTPACFSINA